MPRTKKPAGMAVNPRNGRRTEIGPGSLRRFALPRRDPPLLLETRKAWAALWSDPVVAVLTPADRPVLLRWVDSVERAARMLEMADRDPLAEGSQGQPVKNPLYDVADSALRVARECEAQLGVGALHRARLGLTIAAGKRTLADLNARYGPREGADDEPDPRVLSGDFVVGESVS